LLGIRRTVACWSSPLCVDAGKGGSSLLAVMEDLLDAEEDEEEELELQLVEEEPVELSEPVREEPLTSQVRCGPDVGA
jgi:hypothetical protein